MTPPLTVIDADTHVAEPADLWTSRVSSRWGDEVPHVKVEDTGVEAWYMADQRLAARGPFAMAGWSEYPPLHAPRLEDTDPAIWDATCRLARMDEYGIKAQVLYPNIALFATVSWNNMSTHELQLECVRAYNDFQTDFGADAPDRLLPITVLPFWDVDLSIAEMARCLEKGHRGVVFSQDPSAFGLPGLKTRHWDPLWAAAEEMGQSVNFHIAAPDMKHRDAWDPANGPHANWASLAPTFFLANAATICNLVFSGVCHRFPRLNFVSVESGIGWVPTAMAMMDWQWKNAGVALEHPDYELLPSEYFKRQIYACFWFETDTARAAIDLFGADNFLYETDFPHPTSMSPGPASAAVAPPEFIAKELGDLPDDVLRKLLHDNAARLYRVS